jgi:myo-inositol-1(or 4)-monophosphatase
MIRKSNPPRIARSTATAGVAADPINLKRAEKASVEAARSVGLLMKRHLAGAKTANQQDQYDIKLELDVRAQKIIERTLRSAFPNVSVLGEEGSLGEQGGEHRWVVDPIDGTVNFAYGIPHACISIALQGKAAGDKNSIYADGYQTLVGVVYDPFVDEMWTATTQSPARMNGRPIAVSRRAKLEECLVSIGFAKTRETLEKTLPYFNQLAGRVRKIRMMGAAALALTYVAMGRFDAYVEQGIRLWDVAAGGFILERAGGEFWRQPIDHQHGYRMIASNGLLRETLKVPV